jgi:CrcB protein
MSAPIVLAVGLVGGIGALARFAVDGHVASWAGREFPYGTLTVNVLGAFALGVLIGADVKADAYRVAGVGLIGAFTTFSTWVFESHRLSEEANLRLGVLNLAISLIVGLGAAWAGRHVGSWL